MNIVNIALASSIEEFDKEREELQRRIERLRELLAKRKIEVQFEVWRGHPKYDPEAQKEYDERIRKSQFFFAIIGRAVGKHTKHEIGVAHAQCKESGSVRRPFIKVFFRDLKPEEELTPEEILSGKREPPEMLKSWAMTMGYLVTFSKFEELYSRIIMELIMRGVIFPECKTRLGALWKIRENRRQIRKLSAEGDEAELSILHMENVTLSEAWNMEWARKSISNIFHLTDCGIIVIWKLFILWIVLMMWKWRKATTDTFIKYRKSSKLSSLDVCAD